MKHRFIVGFLFSIVLGFCLPLFFPVALGRLMVVTSPTAPIEEFPAIPEGFLALLGVSTLTALVNRGVPLRKVEPAR